MNLRLLSIISTSVAAFAIVMLLTRGCSDKPTTPPDPTPWRERVETLTKQNELKDARIDSLTSELEKVKASSKVAVSGLKMRVQARDVSLQQAREEIAQFRDSIPQVQRFVEVADSSIHVRDSLITRLEWDLYTQSKLYDLKIAEMADRNVVQKQISSILETKVITLEKEKTKLEKKLSRKQNWNNFWKGLAAGTAAAGAVIILSQ